jgi:hypothetical protein
MNDFEPDSSLIRWHDSCAPEGGQEPVGYIEGMEQVTGSHPSDWVLVLIAIVIAYVAICHPEWVEWSM